MIIPINGAISLNDGKTQKDFHIEYPVQCPICQDSGKPTCIYSTYIEHSKSSLFDITYPDLFVVFFCRSCERVFIGNYTINHRRNKVECSPISFEPRHIPDKRVFSSNIEELSPDFCKIYNQAYASQQYSLDSISGMGYRKALEFLVKDYAIFNNPSEEAKIRKTPLSQCINQYIENDKIKNLALASAWIGNDETHYEKKNNQCTIDSLVAFIDAMVSFINYDLSVMQAEQLLAQRKKNNSET